MEFQISTRFTYILIFVNKWEFSFSRILLWVLIKRFSYTTKFESYKYFFFKKNNKFILKYFFSM